MLTQPNHKLAKPGFFPMAVLVNEAHRGQSQGRPGFLALAPFVQRALSSFENFGKSGKRW